MTEPKTALVTGAAWRIGRAICDTLAADGWHLALHFHGSRTAAAELAAALNKQAGRKVAGCFEADLAQDAETAALAPRIAKEFGAIHALIHNASPFELDAISDAPVQSWDRHIETHLRAPLVLARSFAQQVPDGIDANIIHVFDRPLPAPIPTDLPYALSQCALRSFTEMMARALAPRVRVNGICVASLTTEAKVIADGVCFLLSARSLTGQLIALDASAHPPRDGEQA